MIAPALPAAQATSAPTGGADAVISAATADGPFNATLLQTQARPGPQGDAGPEPGDGRAPRASGSQDDDTDSKDPAAAANAAPAILAVLMQAAPQRQEPATGGTSLPPAAADPVGAPAQPAAALSIALGNVPIPRAPLPRPIPALGTDAPATGKAPVESGAPVASTGDPSDGSAAASTGILRMAQAALAAETPADTAHTRSDAVVMAHLAQLAGSQLATVQAPPAQPLQLALQSNPGQPQFASEVAQQVSWLAGQGIQKAQIQLNPAELGPIHVDITTDHDRVDVTFAVQHPQTVSALQQALPQLHDMLAQQGLNLGQASVGQQAPGQQHAAPAHHDAGANSGAPRGHGVPESVTRWRPLRVAVPGGVDDFA